MSSPPQGGAILVVMIAPPEERPLDPPWPTCATTAARYTALVALIRSDKQRSTAPATDGLLITGASRV